MSERHRCNGWAYALCSQWAIGVVYQRYPDGGWEAQYVCMRHFLEITATLGSRVTTPTHVELHAFDSIGPAWSRS